MNSTGRNLSRCTLYLLFIFGLHTASAAQDEPLKIGDNLLPNQGKTKSLNVRTPSQFPIGTELKWAWPENGTHKEDSTITFLRLEFRAENFSADDSWFISIKNKYGREVSRVTRAAFFGQPPNARAWTERVIGNEVRVELRSKGNPQCLSLTIENLVYSFSDKFKIQAIVGPDQRQDLNVYRTHPYYQWGKPIAILNFVSAETQKETNCTSFLLTPLLLMTNEHCINQAWQLPSAEVIFGFETNTPSSRQVKSKIVEIADTNFDLDYTVLRLSSPVNSWPPVKLDYKPVSDHETLVVIQHSDGRPKLIAATDCSVLVTEAMGRTARLTDFYHKCDTEGGGSGSPVMDLQTGKVIGLHHLGEEEDSTPNNPKNRNLAVKIELVLKSIYDQKREVYDEIVKIQPALPMTPR